MQPNDIRQCKKLWRAQSDLSGKVEKLGFPTIVAEREGKIIGFLSTYPNKKGIFPGPLVLNGSKSIFTVMRLIEAYENVLRYAGVEFYMVNVDKRNNRIVNLLTQLPLEKTRESKNDLWFKRVL
jgi:hypothetical protein